MTTITDRITEALAYLKIFKTPKVRNNELISIEFGQIASLVRDNMLGFNKSIPVKKLAKRLSIEPEEIELAFEALQYLILHFAKTNAVSM